MSAAWKARLRCPSCGSAVTPGPEAVACSCGIRYPVRGGVPIFHEGDGFEGTGDLMARIKLKIKSCPPLFSLLYWASGAFVGTRADAAVRGLPAGALILNLGSGAKKVREDALNVDAHPFPGVAVVADAAKLPFQDASVDAVVCESLLEHVEDPDAVAREIARVLKPGGLAYVLTPFMLGFHSSPSDYKRWTMPGLRRLFPDFEETGGGVAFGPTVAFNYMLASWLSLPLSLGSAKLHQLLSAGLNALLAPLSLLDWVFALHPSAEDFSLAIYFMGTRR